jgi:hypothetical protein
MLGGRTASAIGSCSRKSDPVVLNSCVMAKPLSYKEKGGGIKKEVSMRTSSCPQSAV